MAPERVADMTIEELKAVIAEVVAQQLKSQNFDAAMREELPPKLSRYKKLLHIVRANQPVSVLAEEALLFYLEHPEIVEAEMGQDHTEKNQKVKISLPQRTKAEQHAKNQALIEWLDKWREEGDEEEQRETFEYLKKVLDEDRLSNRPLFPHQYQ